MIIGIYCNRNKWLDKINEYNNFIVFLTLLCFLLLRHFKSELYGGISIDCIIAVFIIFYFNKLCNHISSYSHKIEYFLGTLSMNLKSATPFPKCYLHKEKWTFDS